jgi:hypothetical protein
MRQKVKLISLDRRIKLWLLAWALALLSTSVVALRSLNPMLIFVIPWFPVGLLQAIGLPFESPLFSIVIGWLIYSAVTAVAFKTYQNRIFWIAYGVLCLLLAVNMVGCTDNQMDLQY